MDFESVQKEVIRFRDDRDWEQFHNLKDLSIALNIEAAELLENFLWSGSDLTVRGKENQIKEELADVLIYCINIADKANFDIPEIIADKLRKNNEKYPVEKARGNSRKYTEL